MANVQGIPVYKEVGATPAPTGNTDSARVVIVGAGPVGLAMALDLGRRGHAVTVLNRLDFVAHASKAICFSKRSLDILDRLGVGDPAVEKGVTWNVGKVFWGNDDDPVYQFDALPVKGQKRPGFINIQQYYIEEYLLEGCQRLANIDIRWGHRVDAVNPVDDGVELSVSTLDGDYTLRSEWLIACDGARSTVREKLGLDFEGRVFEDNFLIADVRMKHEMPSERWFWFDPPFNPGRSALMHKQPDDVWRLDFQLGWNVDREAAIRPENVKPFIRAMLGDVEFEQEWYSVYTFQCRRMGRFAHGRTIFAGDSAHLVSPFGARGCNGGLADIDNLGWKLDLVLRGAADETLIETYNDEAIATADENILNSTRSTDFLTPKSAASQALRDAVLELARDHAFARPFVNSGRLSTPVSYPASALSTPDSDEWQAGIGPGSPVLDAPHHDGWLLDAIGDEFVLLARGWKGELPAGVRLVEVQEIAADRLGLTEGGAYLVRPDQYVAARWKSPTATGIEAALIRAKGGSPCLH
ncbi:3-(3-hydroxy-phenyl)propionate hydroxylase [Rhizobium petrolearium]|uniref:FAD-dependent oxidoreductase n=2 Tax=Neorhizobium TaxID=1525371 RepID=A0ABV0MBU4_9HYPH|nr:FAD-dependent oxidoreductase [Neorhizobium petrolearium]MBP1848357.1 3-(3-hydroxy-phenyl)propionate hydroxylase [Neorhizobium petrolearium]MCC2614604.1 FAD-dependent oxidoreductase [Neorhizobium petrolearium]WGI72359.1 FAD-dependent oxidoreductase [Neorhizobium petrolearium]